MALSQEARDRLIIALTSRSKGNEVAKAVDSALSTPAAHVANVTTANATDLPTAQALANANKAKINEILAALQAAGLML